MICWDPGATTLCCWATLPKRIHSKGNGSHHFFFKPLSHIWPCCPPLPSWNSASFILGNCSLLICLLPHRLSQFSPRFSLPWPSVPFSYLPPSVSNLTHFCSFIYLFNKYLGGTSSVRSTRLATWGSTVIKSHLLAQIQFILLGGYGGNR